VIRKSSINRRRHNLATIEQHRSAGNRSRNYWPGVQPGTAGKRVYTIINSGSFAQTMAARTAAQHHRSAHHRQQLFLARPTRIRATQMLSSSCRRRCIARLTAARLLNHTRARPAAKTSTCSGRSWRSAANDSRSDQGAIVSLDGGHTWSDWFTQPTGILSRDHRQRISLSLVRSAAGQRLSRRAFAQRLWNDHLSRLFSTGRSKAATLLPIRRSESDLFRRLYGSVFRLDRTTDKSPPSSRRRNLSLHWETPFGAGARDSKDDVTRHAVRFENNDGTQTWAAISPT